MNDLRFAVRTLTKDPVAFLVSVLSLAIAIGPNSTVFSIVDNLFLKAQPVEGLSHTFEVRMRGDHGPETASYPDYLDLRAAVSELAGLVACNSRAGVLQAHGDRYLVPLHIVSENYFSTLGVKAAAGRILVESDRQHDGTPPVVISHSLWQREFGGSHSAIGEELLLNSRSFVVVGVAPPGFRGLGFDARVDVWLPFSAAAVWSPSARQALARREFRGLQVWARLHDSSQRSHLQTVLAGATARLAQEYPGTNRARFAMLEPVEVAQRQRLLIGFVVLTLAGLVLLIAAANVAGVLLARGEARLREFSIRLAMGARLGRIVRLLAVESLLLSVVSTGLGLLLASWVPSVLPPLIPSLPFSIDFELRWDGRVLAYALFLAVVTAAIATLFPAIRVCRLDVTSAFRGMSPVYRSHFWFRSGLVIAQVALCEFLFVGAGLLLRSYYEIARIRPGFDPARKLVLATLANVREGAAIDYRLLAPAIQQELSEARQISYSKTLPLSLTAGGATLQASVPSLGEDSIDVGWNAVGPRYFSAMGTRVLAGREFEPRELATSVVVNELLAHRFWGGADAAVAKTFRLGGTDVQVIGVVENGRYQTIMEDPQPYVFRPSAVRTGAGEGALIIETQSDSPVTLTHIRAILRRVSPDLTVASIGTMGDHMRTATHLPRLGARLMGIFALIGVALAGVGLYAQVSHNVCRRQVEIGVRVALGARPLGVLRILLQQTMLFVAIGTVCGLSAAISAGRLVSSYLYHVSPADPTALAASATAVAVVTLLAVQIPARRAMSQDPMTVLRSE